jgi:hypothetical protein
MTEKIKKAIIGFSIPFISIFLIKIVELLILFLFGKEWEFNGFVALLMAAVLATILELIYFDI